MALLTAIMLQSAAVALLVYRYRLRSLSRAGFYFILAAIAYHGLPELLAFWNGAGWMVRVLANQNEVQEWYLLASGAILCFSLAYCLVEPVSQGSARTVVTLKNEDLPAGFFLPLGILVLVLATSAGVANSSLLGDGPVLYLLGGVSRDWLLVAPALAAVSLHLRLRGRYTLLIGAVLLTSVFLVGSRTAIWMSLLLFLIGSGWVGLSTRWRSATVLVLMATALTLGLMQLRVEVGRSMIVGSSSAIDRIALAVNGLTEGTAAYVTGPRPIESDTPLDTPEPLGQRLDGNSISSVVLAAQMSGVPSLGLGAVGNEVRVAIPNILWPAKLELPIEERTIKAAVASAYPPPGRTYPHDFLLTQFATLLAAFGPVGPPLALVALGFFFAFIDRYVHGGSGVGRVLVGSGALICALSMEQTMSIYALTARTLLSIGALFLLYKAAQCVWTALRSRSTRKGRPPLFPGSETSRRLSKSHHGS